MNTIVIVTSKNSENITSDFSEPLKLTKIALKEFEMEVSWNTISKKYNNNKFKHHNGQVEFSCCCS